jgi:hypothetical protein
MELIDKYRLFAEVHCSSQTFLYYLIHFEEEGRHIYGLK